MRKNDSPLIAFPKVLECDDELRKQSDGDNFFVSYADDTKMKTFKTEQEANDFKAEIVGGDILREKVEQLKTLQQEIIDLLSKKERWSQECCEKEIKDGVKIIHEGQDDEVMEYCLECGGYIE